MIQKNFLIPFVVFLSVACDKDETINSSSSSSSSDGDYTLSEVDYTFSEPESNGNIFYIDPVNGSSEGDGSSTDPWKTLQEVINSGLIEYYRPTDNDVSDSPLEIVNEGAPVKGDDVLVLHSGYHGYISVSAFVFNDWLTIKAAEGHTPILSQIKVLGAFKNIYMKGLTVIKESYEGEGNYWDAEAINSSVSSCVYFSSKSFSGNSSNIKLNGFTVKTAENTSSWTADDWVQKAASGIGLRSVLNAEIVNCSVENVRHGITIDFNSDNSNVVNNTIKGYSGDGARIISNDLLFAYNTITDCYKVDDNHDDAIQSFTRGESGSTGRGVLSNVVIRGNTIIGTTNPSHPLAAYPQAIGCFDGMFDNWIIENNLIVTNRYHGICLYGVLNSYIINNTVIDQVSGDKECPHIMISKHSDGTRSENCTVANNIVAFSVPVYGDNVEEMNNYVLGKANYDQVYQLFADPVNYDFHLLNNDATQAEIIDQGQSFLTMLSSSIDKDMNDRNSAPDLGAFEY